MLDECAGDRIEELLAVFSTIVLRKVVLAEQTENGGVARMLATEDNPSTEEQKLMLPLVCAHRASLAALLRKRQLLGSRYQEFSQMLGRKSESIVKEYEQLNVESKGRMSQDNVGASEAEVLRRQVRESWLGEAGWSKLVIGGRPQRGQDTILDSTFTDVFTQVKSGDHGCVGDGKSKGLLEDLESRVHDQQERLTRWGQFRDDLRKSSCSTEQRKAPKGDGRSQTKRINVVFRDHQHLLPNVVSHAKTHSVKDRQAPTIDIPQLSASTAYDLLVEKMREELLNVSKPGAQGARSWRKHRKNNSPTIGTEDPSGVKDSPSMWDSHKQDSVSEVEQVEDFTTGMKSEQDMIINRQKQQPSIVSIETVSSVDGPHDITLDHMQPRITTPGVYGTPLIRARIRDPMSTVNVTPTTKTSLRGSSENHTQPVRTNTSEEEDPEVLAEAIISSVFEAAPTPAKPKPSLLERTRMSMALSSIPQTPMGLPVLPTPDTEATAKPQKRPMTIDRSLTLVERTRQSMAMPNPFLPAPVPDAEDNPKPPKAPVASSHGSTLVERTRQSMSMLPATSHQTRKSNYNLRSSRGYPVNQFETPKKQPQPQGRDERSMTASTPPPPPEELFSEADYATVFKSRPKIALSPTVSLSLDADPSLLFDGAGELAGGDGPWDSSPLMRVR